MHMCSAVRKLTLNMGNKSRRRRNSRAQDTPSLPHSSRERAGNYGRMHPHLNIQYSQYAHKKRCRYLGLAASACARLDWRLSRQIVVDIDRIEDQPRARTRPCQVRGNVSDTAAGEVLAVGARMASKTRRHTETRWRVCTSWCGCRVVGRGRGGLALLVLIRLLVSRG